MKTLTHIPTPTAFACATRACSTASRIRVLTVLAASMALAAPSAGAGKSPTAQQTAQQTPMDACVSAFVAASLPKNQRIRIRKETITQSPLDVPAGAYRISLAATGVTSGKRYARATCRVTRGGQVLALNGRPLSAYVAERTAAAAEKTAAR